MNDSHTIRKKEFSKYKYNLTKLVILEKSLYSILGISNDLKKRYSISYTVFLADRKAIKGSKRDIPYGRMKQYAEYFDRELHELINE